jgi:hypothetical protein
VYIRHQSLDPRGSSLCQHLFIHNMPQNVHKLAEVLALTEYHITKYFMIPVEINGVINVKAMLNTRATANFIHQELVDQHRIQTIP